MIHIGIVAHTDRREMAEKLDEAVNADVISFDSGCMGGKENHLRTWEYLNRRINFDSLWADHWGVVLEDDAIPCHAFRWELSRALEKAPTSLVSLYLGRSKPEHWQEPIARVYASDVSWLTAPEMLHGVGYACKWPLIPHLIRGIREAPSTAIDQSISQWAQTHGRTISYSKPSLVDHNDEVPSVTADSDRAKPVAFLDPSVDIPVSDRRVAWGFGKRDKPWDWSRVAITPPTLIDM